VVAGLFREARVGAPPTQEDQELPRDQNCSPRRAMEDSLELAVGELGVDA
jgi:hypothetical protein